MATKKIYWFGVLAGLATCQLACGGSGHYVDAVATVAERANPRNGPPAPHRQASVAEAVAEAAPAGAAHTPVRATPVAAPPAILAQDQVGNTEQYAHIGESTFQAVADAPRSTFSVDVDTASYSNVRRFLTRGALPPPDAVRVEELINYFDYDYGAVHGGHPIAIATELADCPWNARSTLVRIGLQARAAHGHPLPPKNLVFLVDVSGSMNSPNKLPLLKQALSMLTQRLDHNDHVAIVAYAGASGVVLAPTPASEHGAIQAALERMTPGGSTNGAAGIELAYELASSHWVEGGINRVILATDGDFNVGVTSTGALSRLIERERERGVFLTVLGFGMGNLKDATMERLADRGNGNYAYIDNVAEARKVLVDEVGATLHTVAKDAKVQVEFNPARVSAYRLIGYENRRLRDVDFNDDRKDAGEMGDGHSVTALYELRLRGSENGLEARSGVAPLRYQQPRQVSPAADSDELMTVKVRYKLPEARQSQLLEVAVEDARQSMAQASADFRFATAVAGFGLMLRGSPTVAGFGAQRIHDLAQHALGADPHGLRREFLLLVQRAAQLSSSHAPISATSLGWAPAHGYVR